jgi:alkylation response protein AidB-like acyl-CoA dehydrogenase
MNFDFSADQQDIKRTARDLLQARFASGRLRELAEAGADDRETFSEVVALGWPGIAVSESHGGLGLGLIELVILQEELGYALAPLPFLSNSAAALLLEHAGSEEQRERWLPGVLSGDRRGSVGMVGERGAGLVPDGSGAAFVILVSGSRAALVEAESAALQHRPTIDMTRRFARTEAPLQAGEALPGDVAGAMDRVAVALAAECVGLAQRMLEAAVAYAKERRQFGQPIGVHQAVSHRCAQMLLETESARSATYYAAWCADHEPASLPLAAASAKAYASDAGANVTAAALQVHGGIGFTWEHDLHFFLKRARLNGQLFGSSRSHRERIADLIAAHTPAASGA